VFQHLLSPHVNLRGGSSCRTRRHARLGHPRHVLVARAGPSSRGASTEARTPASAEPCNAPKYARAWTMRRRRCGGTVRFAGRSSCSMYQERSSQDYDEDDSAVLGPWARWCGFHLRCFLPTSSQGRSHDWAGRSGRVCTGRSPRLKRTKPTDLMEGAWKGPVQEFRVHWIGCSGSDGLTD
jgi:hypothetical protein